MSSSTTTGGLNVTRHFFPFNTPRTTRSPKSVVSVRFSRQKTWDELNLRASFPTKFVVRSASSAPLSGQYSEQFVGDTTKQDRKKRVAGVEQEEVEDPRLLADSDSCFCNFNGVEIHHKISEPENVSPSSREHTEKKANYPMILLHGFGASVFSWDRAMKSLAEATGSKVLAFDRPAFGLSSRSIEKDSKPVNPFSIMFSVLATLYFIDFLAAGKAILVGHSAGALVAVDAYFEAPEKVAALILVAPAIFAPIITRNSGKEKQEGEANLFGKLWIVLSKFSTFIAGAIMRVLRGMTDMINAVYRKALSGILRSAVGLLVIRTIIDQLGVSAVRSAWYDPSQVSDDVIGGYTKPLKVKGWDRALAEYVVAMVADEPSASKIKQSLSDRLREISCPVLIVTGDTDRLVPAWNSKRLSKAIPGSHLEIIEQCGHLPHEEKTREFSSIVDKFLKRVFGTAVQEEAPLQAVN